MHPPQVWEEHYGKLTYHYWQNLLLMSFLKDKIFFSLLATMVLQCKHLSLQCFPSLVKYDQEFSHMLCIAWPPFIKRGKSNFPNMALLRGGGEAGNFCLKRKGRIAGGGYILKWEDCRNSVLFVVWLVALWKKINEHFHSWNTDIVIPYYNGVTYTVVNPYIVVAYNGNIFPDCNYLFIVNSRNTRPRCKICLKLTIKTPEQRHWLLFNVFILSDIALVSLLLIFKVGHTLFSCFHCRLYQIVCRH